MISLNEKISVIVPIYKVEDYLERCLNTILNQSYKNLEIILIDDGSPDSCGVICDKYAKLDNRITVIHQRNKGLAETRNVGVENAKSDYIVFIDSDDYIESEMIETLYTNLKKYDADISCCGHLEIYPHGYKERNCSVDFVKVYTPESALQCFLYTNEIDVVSWNKLYKRYLFEGIVFPLGKLFEDHYTIYQLLDRANKIVYDSKPQYNYCKRDSSIGGVAFNSRTLQLKDALDLECNYIMKKYPAIAKDITLAKITWLIVIYNKMLLSNCIKSTYRSFLRKQINRNILNIISSSFIGRVRKIQLLLLSISPSLYAFAYKKYIKKYRGMYI